MSHVHHAVEVAKTVVEVAELAWFAVEHVHNHPHHDEVSGAGNPTSCLSPEDVASLRSENQRLRQLLERNLELLQKLYESPTLFNDCPTDLHDRLVAAVDSKSFLSRLQSLRDATMNESSNEFPFKEPIDLDAAEVLVNVDKEDPSWWVWVTDEMVHGKVEEHSRIDDDSYVIVWEDHVVDGVANFIARSIIANPNAQKLSPDGNMELVQLGADRPKTVLILMSDTGGGHRASAEAIRDAFVLEYGDEYNIIIKDVWKEHTGWPLNDMERQYKFMVKHVQLWSVAFHSTSPKWIHTMYLAAIAAFYAKEVEAGLMEYKPDIIISVHPLMQHIPLLVLKWQGLQKKVIFVTVITDLNSCHPTWFHPGVNRCYCPSEEVAKRASLVGLDESQTRVFGLPVRPSFARAVVAKDDLRVELEMDLELPAVLLMGGGEGMGPVKKTAKALAEALFDAEASKPIGQLIIICGRNKSLASSLESMEWKIPVKIRGFEKQMEKWMGASDCIITKAGPGTIAESLIRGLPIILNDYIPGQEKGNVPYVVDNGAGVFTRSPKETAKIVSDWFSVKSDELRKMSENALKLAKPESVFEIVKDIHELDYLRGPLGKFPYMLTSSFGNLT